MVLFYATCYNILMYCTAIYSIKRDVIFLGGYINTAAYPPGTQNPTAYPNGIQTPPAYSPGTQTSYPQYPPPQQQEAPSTK